MQANRVGRGARVACLAVMVVAATLSVVEAAPVSAEAQRANPADLSATPSAPPTEEALSVPERDYRNMPPTPTQAAAKAAEGDGKFDEETSTPIETSETRRVWKNKDGSQTVQASSGIARVQDRSAPSGWRELDMHVAKGSDDKIRPESPLVPVVLGASSDQPLAEISVDAESLRLRLEGIAPARSGAVHNDKASSGVALRGAGPGGIDVDVAPTAYGAKTAYTLYNAGHAQRTLIERIEMPSGWTARQAGTSVELLDSSGAVAAIWAGGRAYDSATEPSSVDVAMELQPGSGPVARARVVIDDNWAQDAARAFPIVVDPWVQTIRYSNSSGAGDEWIRNDMPNSNGWLDPYLFVGSPNGSTQYNTLITFQPNLPSGAYISRTQPTYIQLLQEYGATCDDRIIRAERNTSAWSPSTTWSTKPFRTTAESGLAMENSGFSEDCPDDLVHLEIGEIVEGWANGSYPVYGVTLIPGSDTNQTDYRQFHSGDSGWVPELWITYNLKPAASTNISPANNTVLSTVTPTLRAQKVAADPDGDNPIQYFFRVATGTDGEAGQTVDSGWITPDVLAPDVEWTPPPGYLRDGVTYSWHVWTMDSSTFPGAIGNASPPWTFKVDLRLGNGPSPTDSFGPVSVNMATGNVLLETGTPSGTALGGSAGLRFSYNSLAPQTRGLTGAYSNDWNNNRTFDDGTVVSRVDPEINFDWWTGSPMDGIYGDNFLVKWTGFLTVPTTGTYQLGTMSDDGTRISVGGGLVLDNWRDQSITQEPIWSSSVSLTANVPTPIVVDYYENTINAAVSLWIKSSQPGQPYQRLPGEWLSTDAPALPQGWTLSADLDGDLSYVSARRSESSVTLIASDGSSSEFRSTGFGYTPPPGEDGVLAVDPDGGLSLLDGDGQHYRFNADGTLASVSSSADDRTPAALTYSWSGSPARLRSISDSVSGRTATLNYGGDGSCPTGPASGFDAAAPQTMLCAITHWDGTKTKLWYVGGRLGRVEDPGTPADGGAEITDFVYGTGGRLIKVRDPLAADAVTQGLRTDDDTTWWAIAYDALTAKPTSVTAPAPSAGAARPKHTYRYVLPTETQLDVAGMSPSNGYARRVVFDTSNRLVDDYDSAGLKTTTIWKSSVSDLRLATIDPAGKVTATEYDYADRPVKTYGPAPSSCFTNGVLNGNCPSVPTAQTKYDEGFKGLAATYWSNRYMSGLPTYHDTGDGQTGTAGEDLIRDWGQGSPAPGVSAGAFSARFTGEVTMPATGTYQFSVNSDDGVRLWIDDTRVVDRFVDGPGTATGSFNNTDTTKPHRVRVDYYNVSGPAYLNVYWTPPGGSQQPMPNLAPRYGLVTTSIDPDGKVTKNEYDPEPASGSEPELGVVSATVVDPAGLNLRTRTSYEQRGSGFLRRTSRSLPASAASYAGTILADQPTGYWRLGGTSGSTVPDASGNGFNGTYTGSPQLGVTGALSGDADGATVFDGVDDSVDLGQPSSLAQQRFTVETWFKTSDATSNQMLYRWRYYGIGLSLSQGRLAADMNNTAGANPVVRSPASYADGSWHHVGYTYDGTALRLVVDGTEVASTPATGTVYYPISDRVSIGRDGSAGTFWHGSLDEVAVYDRALTVPQLQAHLTAGRVGPTSTYSYYGATETADNPCTTGAESIKQAGAVKLVSSADPDGNGVKKPIVRETRYDLLGRPVATLVEGDANWRCTTYDSRGRVTETKDPSGKVAKTTYTALKTVLDYTDSAGVPQATTSEVDLLGRAVAYTDEHGTKTRRTYDQAGRLTATFRAFNGAAETTLSTSAYDAATGRLASTSEYVSGSARTTSYGYDTAGRPSTTTLPNGVVTTTGYDATTGRLGTLSHVKGASNLSSWSYVRSPSGDITSETETRTGATSRTRTFTFDNANRLTKTVEGAATRNYAYDPNTNRCGLAIACDGQWTYDAADRLTASPYGTNYVYDDHGNLTSATSAAPAPTNPVNEAFPFNGGLGTVKSKTIEVGSQGPVSASLDWTSTPLTQRAIATGAIAPGGSASADDSIDGKSHLSSVLTWPKALHTPTDAQQVSVPASGATTKQFATDAAGTISAALDWGSTSTSYWVDGAAPQPLGGSVSDHPITVTGNGTIELWLGWDNGFGTRDMDFFLLDPSGAQVAKADKVGGIEDALVYQVAGLTYPQSRTYTVRVVAKTLGNYYTVSGTKPDTANLNLTLENGSGVQVAFSTLTAGQARRTLSYTGAAGTYVLRTSSSSPFASSATLTESHPRLDHADLGVLLRDPAGGIVADTRSANGTLNLAKVSSTPGTYQWFITNFSNDLTVPSYSLDHGLTKLGDGTATGSFTTLGTNPPHAFTADGPGYASVKITWGAGSLGTARLSAVLKGPAGQVQATQPMSTSPLSFEASVPAAGTYTVEVTNHDVYNVPSYTVTTTLPKDRSPVMSLELKNSSGTVVATAAGTKPKTLATTVNAGTYTLVATATSGLGNATLTGTYPGARAVTNIGYDANDHATVIDDGTTLTTETLSPSGRVIRRVVKTKATQAVVEDIIMGYDDDSDGPAYSKPSSGGTVTSYLDAGGGLAIDVGGAVSYQLANAHGDVVGTADATGAFTPLTTPDEFGVGTVPGSRLGWLGTKQRFTAAPALGLVRMGVRLYDPKLGRFLQVDPVEGGSANDYDYVEGDPVNNFDLDGRFCLTGKNKNGSCRSIARGVKRSTKFRRRLGIQVNACVGYGVAGCASAGVSFRDGFYFSRGTGHGFGWSGPSVGPTLQSGGSARRGDCHSAGVGPGGGASCYGGHRVYSATGGLGTGGYFHTRYTTYAWKPWR